MASRVRSATNASTTSHRRANTFTAAARTLDHMDLRALLESRPFDPLPDVRDLLVRPAWHAQAACPGTDANFYPDRGESVEPAKALCSTCPVVDECKAFALDSGEQHGVWGGLSGRERRTARKARAAA